MFVFSSVLPPLQKQTNKQTTKQNSSSQQHFYLRLIAHRGKQPTYNDTSIVQYCTVTCLPRLSSFDESKDILTS